MARESGSEEEKQKQKQDGDWGDTMGVVQEEKKEDFQDCSFLVILQ
jgi:hypothetical protein